MVMAIGGAPIAAIAGILLGDALGPGSAGATLAGAGACLALVALTRAARPERAAGRRPRRARLCAGTPPRSTV